MLEISVPTLLVDKEKVIRNIHRMMDKARNNSCTLRPHFKTHQSVEIGEWFRDEGIDKITVSSLDMALKFASAGWDDITVAFPVNILEITKIKTIVNIVNLTLLVEDKMIVEMLDMHLDSEIALMIKIDSGYGRTGVRWNNVEMISGIIDKIAQSKSLVFKGFLIHAGHSYQASGSAGGIRSRILQILDESLAKIDYLRARFLGPYPNAIMSYGDTPSCSIGDNFSGIDELRPGNFVFYDLTQQSLGACSYNDIAVTMTCPVVAIHPERMEVIIYGGAVHFSKDYLIKDGQSIFGQVVSRIENARGTIVEGARLASLSQEHGIVRYSDSEQFMRVSIGDILYIYPVHSCLTADCMGEYLSLDGEKIKI